MRTIVQLLAVSLVATFALAGGVPVAAQPLPEPVVGKPGELVANGGFDVGDRTGKPIAWGVEGNEAGANIVNLSAWRSAGLGSLEVKDVAGSSVSVRTERIVATSGATYEASAKVRIRTGTPANLLLEFWDFDQNLLTTKTATPGPSPDFQTVALTATAPAKTAHVTLQILADGPSAGDSYWDQVMLEQVPLPYDKTVGTNRQLFLDDYRIESSHDLERVVHPGTKRQLPVIRAEKPWEISAYTYGSAFKIGDKYKLWYTCYSDVAPNYHMCYAESTNGVDWVKPQVGRVAYKEIPASQTNIVLQGSGTIAYNPEAPADRTFLLMKFQGAPNGYYGWKSPNGLDWTPLSPDPLLLDGDVSQVTYDATRDLYIASIKKRMFTSRTPGIYERSAFVSTSKDFLTWTEPQLATSGDYADDGLAESIGGLEGQIYGMPILPYEGMYIGLPWVFLTLNYTAGQYASAADGPVLPQVAASRDLLRWVRPVRGTLLEPSLGGAWDDGALYTASNILVTDKEIRLYYAGFNNGHGGADPTDPNRDNHRGQTGLATWRRDGFVSLTNRSLPGTGDAGELVTRPLVFSGRDLHVNGVVFPKGELRVSVLDAAGNELPGYSTRQALPVRGDHLDSTVRWTGGRTLRQLAGQEVRFKFSVVNADLYSYWVR